MIILSLNKLRLIDIVLFTFIAVVIDIVIGLYGLLGLKLFISVGIPTVLFLYIRWGKYALIANGTIIIVHFIVHYVNLYVMIAHSLGLLSLSLAILFVKWKKLLKRNIAFQHIFLYFLSLYVLMLVVEWFLLIIFNQDVSFLGHILNHSLNIFLSIGLLYMISRQKDLMVNIDIYLKDNVEGD